MYKRDLPLAPVGLNELDPWVGNIDGVDEETTKKVVKAMWLVPLPAVDIHETRNNSEEKTASLHVSCNKKNKPIIISFTEQRIREIKQKYNDMK